MVVDKTLPQSFFSNKNVNSYERIQLSQNYYKMKWSKLKSHNKARKFLFDGKLSKRVGDLQTDKNNNFA